MLKVLWTYENAVPQFQLKVKVQGKGRILIITT